MIDNSGIPKAKNIMKTEKPTASQQVADYLHHNIQCKMWRVGGKIPSENTLTRELGVSRVSVRLAIQQFITLGVLESVRGKGTYLKTDNIDIFDGDIAKIGKNECRDVTKVLQFRSILEPEACYLAAVNSGPDLIERLRKLLHAMVADIGNSEGFIKNDMQFHLEISRASGNPLLHKALREVFEQTRKDHKQINNIFGYKDGVYYHSLILKAFEAKDPKLARKLMSEHLQHALSQLDRD